MTKQKKILLGLLLALAALLVLYFAVIRPLGKEKPTEPKPPIDLLDGEAYYYNNGYIETSRVLFPQYSRADISVITVKNDDTTYSFFHYISDASSDAKSYFLLGVDKDGDGETEFYSPAIASRFESFDYTTLYDDTTKIPTVLAAAGIGYFKDRVYIRANDESNPTDEQYQEILSRYGLSDADSPAYYEILGYELDENHNVVYEYAPSEGESKVKVYVKTAANGGKSYVHADGTAYTGDLDDLTPRVDSNRYQCVYVGDMTPDKTGYYLYVKGRDVIYTTGTSSIGDVVYRDLSYYVNPRLITATSDSYAPYMPVDFRIWSEMKTEAESVVGENSVVGYYVENTDKDGVDKGSSIGFFNLLGGDVDERIRRALLGAREGDVLTITDIEPYPVLSPLAEGKSVTYEIYAVLGIVGDTAIDTTVGTVTEASDTVLVQYRLRSGDEVGALSKGVVDLTRPGLSPSLKETLVGMTVGAEVSGQELGEPLKSCTVTLDSDYADKITYSYRITSIVGYATKEDLSDIVVTAGKRLPQTGYAVINYTVEIDGVVYEETDIINLGAESGYLRDRLRRALLTKVVDEDGTQTDRVLGAQTDLALSISYAYSPISAYTVYENLTVKSVSSYREEISFGFVNELDRDAFYGASIYEITGPLDRTMYAIDSTASQTALKPFSDLLGSETVHVGLTPEAILEYGLSAHVFYFEMPFGIYEDKRDGNEDVVTYAHQYSIGYYLYVSELQKDGTYYAASTQYDIVVKVDAETLGFIDWDFSERWAQRNLMQVKIADIQELSFDINFSDLKEAHSFALTTNPSYYVYGGINSAGNEEWVEQNRVYVWYVRGSSVPYKYTYGVTTEQVVLDNRQYGGANMHKYYIRAGRMLIKNGSTYVVRDVDASSGTSENLDERYERLNGKISSSGVDYEGVVNFKNLLQLIYLTYYSGSSSENLDADEIAEIVADPEKRIFNIRMQLTSDTAITAGGREFNISFYRYSDSRCLVRFSDEETGAVSTEFYLNYAEVKNLVTAVRTVVGGGTVTNTNSWLPEPVAD